MQKQSRAISARLQLAGLAPGDKVAFLSDNGLFTVQLFLGTMYGGLVIVPLNVRAGVTQLAYTLEHCDAKAVFVEDQYAALAREALANATRPVQVITTNMDAFATDDCTQYENIPIATPSAEDIALLMYTSGSVGVPKAAIHSHRTVLAHGRNSMRSHQLTAADRSLLVLPIYHINAECVTLMPGLGDCLFKRRGSRQGVVRNVTVAMLRRSRGLMPALAQQPQPLHLAGRTLREVRHKMDSRRRLEVAQAALAKGKHLPFVACHARPQHGESDQVLAQVMIGNAHCCRFQNCGMRLQHLVDLAGGDVHPTLNDQFLGTPDDEEVAVPILVCEVAGMHPALCVEHRCRSPWGPCNSPASQPHR
jgi:AMP-binding enzyme